MSPTSYYLYSNSSNYSHKRCIQYEVAPSYNERCRKTCVSTKDFTSLQYEKRCTTISLHNNDLYRFIDETDVPQHVYTILSRQIDKITIGN